MDPLMDPQVVIPEVIGIGVAYALLPAIAIRLDAARGEHTVACPETGQPAKVHLDLKRAVKTLFTDGSQSVRACSRWPEKAGCGRECERDLRV